jgi:pSer/pThr/pTyr-binding forkhead associated (FHA) protein
MENLGLTVVGAVCLCIGGLFLGIAIVLLVQWYSKQQLQAAPSFPVRNGSDQTLLERRGTGWLIITQGPNRGSSILLDQPIMRIGRDPANEIVVDHPQVSRYHARFIWENGRVYVEDTGSSNGTYLNRVRIEGRKMIKNGDAIGLGMEVLLTFYQ